MKKYIYLLVLTFFSTSVLAVDRYGGIGLLKSETNIYKYPTLTYTEFDDEDNGFTIFLGYDYNERFAVELGYSDLGETKVSVSDSGGLTADHDTVVMTVAGLLKTDPIAENIVLFVKAGLARIHDDEEISGASTNKTDIKTNDIFYGLGINYELPNGLIVRGLYEDYGETDGLTDANSSENKPDKIEPNAISLSLIKRF